MISIQKVARDPKKVGDTGLEYGFLTGGTCTPWGYEAPMQGVRDEVSE